MPRAGGLERLPTPPTPAALQAQAGDVRHQVELGGPRVSAHDRPQPNAFGGERDVTLLQDLVHGIVASNVETNLGEADGLGIYVLVVAQPVES